MDTEELSTQLKKMVNERNFEIVNKFLGQPPNVDDFLTSCLFSIVSQFLMGVGSLLENNILENQSILGENLIKIQIKSLEKCASDLKKSLEDQHQKRTLQ
jgi:flagellar capping protein FliD